MNDTSPNLHNYKSLFEEIAQTDNSYLFDDSEYYNSKIMAKCYCCKLQSTTKPNNNINKNKVKHESNLNVNNSEVFKMDYEKMPVYSSILIHEMRNATDYLEYLNRIRRNSSHSLGYSVNSNMDNNHLSANYNQVNYYQISVSDYSTPLDNEKSPIRVSGGDNNFLKVPKFFDEEMRKTPELQDIKRKVHEIDQLDNSVSALIYKSIEVHADILVISFCIFLKVGFEPGVSMVQRPQIQIF